MATEKWGIDLGGTKIEGVVLAEDGAVLLRERIPTEADGGYDHILDRIALLVDQLAGQHGRRPQHIGIGTPGTIDPPTGLLKNSNTVALNGQPFLEDLTARLGLPVKMANDANCFAVAETRLGVVRDEMPHARLVFGVIMGTGVGGGIVIDGEAWTGAHGIGGEWGHMFLDDSGGECYCGKIGCVERLISGPALERFYAERTGTELRLPAIVERHRAGTDPDATATVERLLHFFAKGIANVINVLDPDCVVLGGGLGQIDLLYTEGVARIVEHLFNPRLGTRFLRPKLGDSAGVFGAAML
jgi:predicted NBD/HSP70 family sugar kinase